MLLHSLLPLSYHHITFCLWLLLCPIIRTSVSISVHPDDPVYSCNQKSLVTSEKSFTQGSRDLGRLLFSTQDSSLPLLSIQYHSAPLWGRRSCGQISLFPPPFQPLCWFSVLTTTSAKLLVFCVEQTEVLTISVTYLWCPSPLFTIWSLKWCPGLVWFQHACTPTVFYPHYRPCGFYPGPPSTDRCVDVFSRSRPSPLAFHRRQCK